MLTCRLHLIVKSKAKYPFLMYRLLVNVKHLRLLSTANLTFAEVFTHFDNFLPSTFNFDTVYTLAYRCSWTCSSWTKLHELVSLKQIFLKIDYLENFVNKWFENFMDNIHVVKESTLTVEKNQYPYKLGLSWKTQWKVSLSVVNW